MLQIGVGGVYLSYMKIFISFLLIFNLLIPYSLAGEKVKEYKVPDVKTRFCGPAINYEYCKCAFHDQYCERVAQTPSTAHAYVLEQFKAWNKVKIQQMAELCVKRNGSWNKNRWECTTCTEGDVLDGRRCVEPDEVSAEEEEESSKAKECKEALKNIKTDWKKYSDFDDRLGSDVSYEVQQFNKTFNEVADLIGLSHSVEYEIVMMQGIQEEVENYKVALVQNIKVNLLKSFWRLSYVTYSTIKSGLGMEGTVRKLIDPKNTIQAVGAGLKLVQSIVPPYDDAKFLQIDTASTSGKVKSMLWNATLETLESVGDPASIATQAMKDARAAVLPSANISKEEVAILRDQHLSNKAVDEAIASGAAEIAELRKVQLETKRLIVEKYNVMQEWKLKEYRRVKGNLEDSCKDKNN